MLDRAGDSQRYVELRRDCLSRRSDLAIDRQPFGVANRTRSGDVTAEGLGQLLRQHQIVFTLDAAPDSNDDVSFRQIDGLFRFLERRLGFHADLANLNGRSEEHTSEL